MTTPTPGANVCPDCGRPIYSVRKFRAGDKQSGACINSHSRECLLTAVARLRAELERVTAQRDEALLAQATPGPVARLARLGAEVEAAARVSELEGALGDARPLVEKAFMESGEADEEAWRAFLARIDRLLAPPAAQTAVRKEE